MFLVDSQVREAKWVNETVNSFVDDDFGDWESPVESTRLSILCVVLVIYQSEDVVWEGEEGSRRASETSGCS